MRISQAQLDQLADARFLDRLVGILAESDPGAGEALRTPEGKRILRQQYDKALTYGLVTELDAARYVITAWLLGTDFDTRFPAMREILGEPRLSPSQKAEAIERVSTALLQTLRQGSGP